MKLTANTKVHELLTAHPFMEDFLPTLSPKFEMLRNRMARATIGRVATLRTAAGIADLDLEAMLRAVAEEIATRTGERPVTEAGPVADSPTRESRVEALKGIIRGLHDGGDLAEARARFAEAVADVEATEIAAMEEQLIRGGLPVSEVQRLCDVHVGAFRQALDEHEALEAPPGHPVDTFLGDNRAITTLANRLGMLAQPSVAGRSTDWEQAAAVTSELGGVDNHYQRKENQLFPVLERHGITGPSQVMWGVHDQIRAALKNVRDAVARRDAARFAALAPGAARDLVEMVYKEEKILFPMAMQTLSTDEWAEVRRGEADLGYVLSKPRAEWPAVSLPDSGPVGGRGLLDLATGLLSLEQVNLLFRHLPVDLSFVDEDDAVRFYSEGPDRLFPRSPAVIGRKVQNCHPPKSVHMVQEILDSFRAGRQSTAEFWIEMCGKTVHIRYFAVRDGGGAYRGCLEVTQDVTGIRALVGERRLLSWDGPSRPSGTQPAAS